MPRLYILSGCNGSGKTTASYTLLPELLECSEFVNSDEFAKSLSPFNPSDASVSASRYMLMKIRYLLNRRADFSIETTLATRSLVGIIEEARSLGYFVTVLYLWLKTPEMAIKRVADRVAAGGHRIPEDVIRRRYSMGIRYLFDTYIPICDRWVLADNTQSPFVVVAEGNKDGINIKDEEKYNIIKEIAHPTKKDEQ
ncbi:MAG: zeta toxin family protein [Bacteroidales bacterium]|nr:zeta toxin family protein [Bacteroidales bacterium]